MKASLLLKRLFGGGILFLGLLWIVLLPALMWRAVAAYKLGVLTYAAIGMCCLVTGVLVLRLTRQRLLATSLGVALLWSLAASSYLVSFTYTRTYAALVSEVPQDMLRVELTRTRFVLECLRAGDTNRAIESLEALLTSDIARLDSVPVAKRKPKTISVLERARTYQAAHPWTGQDSIPN